jgi:uncharacterized membrane protein
MLAITVRILYISQPLMVNESRIFVKHIYHVTNGVKGVFSLLTQYDEPGHHIFYTLLGYLTYKFLGSEQWTWIMRLPALFAGILLVPVSYMVTRIFHNKNAALLASGIVACSSPLIFYSAQARGYTIQCVIFLLLLSIGTYIKNNTDLAGWHLFAILSAFGAYTNAQFLYPCGIAFTWLILSILFEDTAHIRSHLLRNLFISITITGFLTFLFYSPVIFLGTGLKSILHNPNIIDASFYLAEMPSRLYYIFSNAFWGLWNKSVPVFIQYLFIAGFICSLVFHKKLSIHRVSIVLSGAVYLITLFLVQKLACPFARCWLFFLPIYIGLASAGIIYLFKPIESISGKYKTVVFALLTITISFILIGNKVRSEPYFDSVQMQEVDSSGKHIEFRYIETALRLHYKAVPHQNVKTLILFPSQSQSDFWRTRLQHYFSRTPWSNEYLISDLNSYLSKDSWKCHYLFVVSSGPIPVIETLLEDKRIFISDYSVPKLIHRFKYADVYRMRRTTDCKEESY